MANIYLHYVYDLWVQQWRRRHARSAMDVVRYADRRYVGASQDAALIREYAELFKPVPWTRPRRRCS